MENHSTYGCWQGIQPLDGTRKKNPWHFEPYLNQDWQRLLLYLERMLQLNFGARPVYVGFLYVDEIKSFSREIGISKKGK